MPSWMAVKVVPFDRAADYLGEQAHHVLPTFDP